MTPRDKYSARDSYQRNRDAIIEAAIQQGLITNDLVNRAVANTATPFGCCNFFDQCGDGDLMSLHYRGTLGLLDLMNFMPTDVCKKVVEFITYVRPEQSGGNPTAAYLSDVCANPNGIEYGSCDLTVEDFGYLARQSDERNIQIAKRYCETSPRYRLDGQPVNSEFEWDMLFVMDALLDDVRRMMITGNATTTGQFDGLQRWVRTGYTQCLGMIDSHVVNWNSNQMTGGAGMTYNGNAISANVDIVEVLEAINRRINQRIGWSPVLRSQTLRPGQKVLLMPNDWIECLLDFYTCWSVCEAGQTVSEVSLNSLDARAFRRELEGGMFGDGEIMLGKEVIPILGYDWELINGGTPNTADMYLLTLGVGTQRFWEGDILDAQNAMSNIRDMQSAIGQGYFETDGGRVLGKEDLSNLCRTLKLWMTLRLFCRAPWAQARIQDVRCINALGDPLSADPESDYFVTPSFSPANCP